MIRSVIALLLALTFSHIASAAPQTYALVSDLQSATKNARLVREAISRTTIRDLIMPGDQLDRSGGTATYNDLWDPWAAAGFNFFIVALGNHYVSFKEETEFFKLPGPYYSKVRDGVRFIVLASDGQKTATVQAAWLKEQLETSNEKMNFVIFHQPPYKVGYYHPWQERKKFLTEVRPILFEFSKKISALFVGHNHMAALYTIGDLPVVLSGSTAEPRTETLQNYEEDGVQISGKWKGKKEPTWAKLTIDPEKGETKISFIAAIGDQEVCNAKIVSPQIKLEDNCQ